MNLWFTDVELCERLVTLRKEVGALLADLGGKVSWREPGEKTRELRVGLDADVSYVRWGKLCAWLVRGLFKLRSVAGPMEKSHLVAHKKGPTHRAFPGVDRSLPPQLSAVYHYAVKPMPFGAHRSQILGPWPA